MFVSGDKTFLNVQIMQSIHNEAVTKKTRKRRKNTTRCSFVSNFYL